MYKFKIHGLLNIINKLIEMNSLIKICPNCKKHMKYALDKQFIKMNCKCGFSSLMKIKKIVESYVNINNKFCETVSVH